MQKKNMEEKHNETQRRARGLKKMKQFQGVKSRINNGTSAAPEDVGCDQEEEDSLSAAEVQGQRQGRSSPGKGEQENDVPLFERKHTSFLRKKSGDYRTSEQMAKLSLSKSKEEVLANPSPRIEAKRREAQRPALHNQVGLARFTSFCDVLRARCAPVLPSSPTPSLLTANPTQSNPTIVARPLRDPPPPTEG